MQNNNNHMGSASSSAAYPGNANSVPGFVTARGDRQIPRHQRQLQPPIIRQNRPVVPRAINAKPPNESKELVVIAIDFGMTFTGYAFGFKHASNKIYTSTHGGRLAEDREPTTVLLKPDQTFHSFGFKAEEKYAELMKGKKHKNWMYFEKFKMALYETKNIKRDTAIKDKQGNEMPAILIFTMIIQYLKEQVESCVCPTQDIMNKHDLKWLITVPAIWSDAAKQFMREAALNAGIHRDKFHLALEPEAASTYCLEQAAQWQRQYFGRNQEVVEFSRGFKYILADIGGGTADICVHEVIENCNIKEIYKATGDALGGCYVNEEFVKFLQKLVGAPVLHKLQQTQAGNYLQLMKDFETKKKNFHKNTKDLRFSIHPDVCDLIKQETGEPLESSIPHTRFAGKVKFLPHQNKLIIPGEIIKEFFDTSINGIILKLKNILAKTNDPEIGTLILVGGYSESPYLKECVESGLNNLRVLQDPDARLTVLKGAVMLGFKPSMVDQRIAQYSYGFYMIQHYENTMHPQDLKLYHDGTFYCDCIFLKQIEKGQTLTLGQAFTYKSTNKVVTQQAKTQPFLVRMVRSTKKDPQFCTEDEGCHIQGEIKILPPLGGWPNKTNLTMHLIVGETEFVVNVFDETTGQSYEAEINFL